MRLKRFRYIVGWCLGFSLGTGICWGQVHEMQAHGQWGYVLPHRAEMNALVTGHSWGFGVERGNWGVEGWRADWCGSGAVWQGMEWSLLHAGSPEMGSIFSGLWKVKLPIVAGVNGELGTGLGWAFAPYDLEKRPLNFALGTHGNAGLHLGLSWRCWKGKQSAAVLSGGLTHFSNGAVAMPNLGINNFFVRLALVNQSYQPPTNSVSNELATVPHEPSWSAQVSLRTGTRDVNLPGGPRHALTSATWSLQRHLSARWSGVTAVEATYNQSLREASPVPLSALDRLQWANQAGVALHFGRVTLLMLQGWVWVHPDTALGRRHLTATLNYSMNPTWSLDLALRSFQLRADYAALGVTRRFGKGEP